MITAFDVGADDGLHGILLAFMNPKIKVYGFEPIENAKKRILSNVRKVEKYFGTRIKNYTLINCAISDYNGYSYFYETNYNVASSLLKPKKKLNQFWTKSNDFLIKAVTQGIKLKKKYKVKVMTLDKFCKENSIKVIRYLHIDAQGNDLRVIRGLYKYKKSLIEGVAESSKNNKLRKYNNEQSFYDLKKKFKKWKFIITKIETVQKNFPYYNIYFKNNPKVVKKINNITFNNPTNRLGRLFKRIFLDKNNIKDHVYCKYWKVRNYFI